MSFKRFFEAREKQTLTVEQAIAIVEQKVPHYDVNSQLIVRGNRSRKEDNLPDIFISSPGTGRSKNMYNIIIDNAEEWKEYPKRTESFICSTSQKMARSFGDVYLAIPLNLETKIGICPANDIWYSFKQLRNEFGMEIVDVYDAMKRLAYDSQVFTNYYDYDSLKDYLEQLKEKLIERDNQELRFKEKDQEVAEILLKLFEKYNKPLTWILEMLMSPEENGFELVDFKNYKNHTPSTSSGQEVWFSTETLFVKERLIDEVFV